MRLKIKLSSLSGLFQRFLKYRQTSLYVRDRDRKIRVPYNEFVYKKTKDTNNLGDMFLKKGEFQSHICEISDKKAAYNEVHL